MKVSDDDLKRLNDTITAFNNKIMNISEDLRAIQPKLIPLYRDKSSLSNLTRHNFEYYINQLKKYMEPGSELSAEMHKGLTQWESETIKSGLDKINEYRVKERERVSKLVSPETGTMGTIQRANLLPKKENLKTVSKKDRPQYAHNILQMAIRADKETKAAQYKQNLLDAVEREFGSNSVSYKRVKSMSKRKLYDAYFSSPFLSIDWVYDSLQEENLRERKFEEALNNIDIEDEEALNNIDIEE